MLRNVRDPLVYFHIRWLRKLNRTGGCLATSASDLGQFPQSRPLNSTLGGLRDWTARCRCCYQSSRWSFPVSLALGELSLSTSILGGSRGGNREGKQEASPAGRVARSTEIKSPHTPCHTHPPFTASPHPPPCGSLAPEHHGGLRH